MSALRYLASAIGTECSHLLKPVKDICSTGDTRFPWRSTGNNPEFEISSRIPFFPGLYMVEISLTGTMAMAVSRLYFNCGDGYSKEDSVELKGRVGNRHKRLIVLNKRCVALRLEPLEAPADFCVESLRIIPVTQQFALTRMLRRITKKISEYRLTTTAEAKENIEKLASIEQKKYIDIVYEKYNMTFESVDYKHWINSYEKDEFSDSAKISREIGEFKKRPLVSIVMPVHNINENFLRKAIESVRSQTYDHWQLCIVDDASTNPKIKPMLLEFKEIDSRIEVVFSEENKNIAGASNLALSFAKGEYVAFLDHDDCLASHALFALVRSINENPNGQIFYSDEDKIDEAGNRSAPYFKPDWNQDLFYSYNYLCHFTAVSHQVISDIGGFRSGVDGTQDYDLLLRAAKRIGFKNIVHIPHVLYHWRTVVGSVAASAENKSYTTLAGIKALEDHFASLGKKGVQVKKGAKENLYRVQFPIPAAPPLVSLIIPTRNKIDYIKPCIVSILERTRYSRYEIILIDNQSDDAKTLRFLEDISRNAKVRVIKYDDVFNYSAINNFGVRHANGEIIGLLNSDTEVIDEDWLSEMVSQAIRPDIGCVGAKLLYQDNTVQHAGVILGLGGSAGHCFVGLREDDPGYYHRAQVTQNYSAVTAACLLLRKSVFEEANGLDEENFKIAFNDVDLCLKVGELGLRNLWTPYAKLYHLESKTRGYEDTTGKKKRFESEVAALKLRWASKLESDPAYNPNLGTDKYSFEIKT